MAVGVIPARWGSQRLPGKSLIPLCGKPLIQRVLEQASRASRLDALFVATDDVRILNAVKAVGYDAVMTRAEHSSGTDRVAEAVAGGTGEIIVNIQGDEPLIEPGLIDALVEAMADPAGAEMATAATPIRSAAELNNPSVVKVVRDQRGLALYFSRSVIPFVRDGGAAAAPDRPLHWRHIGAYAYRRAFLERLVAAPPSALEQAERLEQLRALHIGGRIRVLETEYAGVGVDTADDVARVERLIRERGMA